MIQMQSTILVILPMWAVFSLSLSLPPQMLPKSTLYFSALSYYKSSVETNFPIFAITFSH